MCSDILSGMYCDIHSDILSGMYFGVLSDVLPTSFLACMLTFYF